jgi:hypothetical protein
MAPKSIRKEERMTRNLKVLGIALAAVFALSAVIASAAMAQKQGKITSDGPVTLKGTETGTGLNRLTAFHHIVECPGSTITGHKWKVTPHELIPSGETTATITPHYTQENCVAIIGASKLPATVDMVGGCDYVFHVGKTIIKEGKEVEGEWPATADICPEGGSISVTVFSSSSEALKLCTITVAGGQLGREGIILKNTAATGTTKNDVDATGTVKNIHVERDGLCKGEEGTPDTETTGEFHLDATIKGYNKNGEETGVTISD